MRFELCSNTHLSDDRTVAKMGHPKLGTGQTWHTHWMIQSEVWVASRGARTGFGRSICVDLDRGGFSACVVVEAAPAVVFRSGDEASCYGLPPQPASCPGTPGFRWMYWTLLDEFSGGEGIEVVVPGLPEVVSGAFEEFGGFAFEDSQELGEGADFRFAGEKVDVLGHQDVGINGEGV